MTYTADDVRDVQTYMAYKQAANQGELRRDLALDIQATMVRGHRVLEGAMLKYSRNRGEAVGAEHRASPIVRRMYQGATSYYWLVPRSAPRGKR